MLTPTAQCSLCAVITLVILSVLVCLPTFVVLRIDGSLLWPWAAVLGPIWLINVLICAGLIAQRSLQRENGGSGLKAWLTSISWRPLLLFTLLVAFEVLLTLKLDHPLSGLRYLLAFAPLLLYLTPGLLSAGIRLAATLKRRARPQSGDTTPPPLDAPVNAFALQLLLLLSVLLVALRLDRVFVLNWWIVLIPVWMLFAVLGRTLRQAWASIAANTSRPAEERTARWVQSAQSGWVGRCSAV